jgi:hypothetical protein
MSTQETTTKTAPANSKKAKASKKPAKAKKAATPKKTAKATKAKGAPKSGSKASIVLDLMKRKEGGHTRGNRQGDRLAESQHSRIRQWPHYQEATVECRIDEERSGGANVPDRELIPDKRLPYEPAPNFGT